MAGKKTLLDFPFDIYYMHGDYDELRERLAQQWKAAVSDNNPAEAVYMLFQLEGYDVPYEDCVKLVKTYKKMEAAPPWEEGGPVCY
jgi:hypothetical protein